MAEIHDSRPGSPVLNAYTDKKDVPKDAAPVKRRMPIGFANEPDFITAMNKLMSDDVAADSDNREAAAEDLKFFAGKQWDEFVRAQRNLRHRPSLTINRLPAFVGQVLGARRFNDVEVKVLPTTDGDKETAEIYEDLIRFIQHDSHADFAFNTAYQGQAICGIGNFEIDVDYAADDVFDKDIHIRAIEDPLSVIWDKNLVEPTGSDARHVFVVNSMGEDEFDEAYPGMQSQKGGFGEILPVALSVGEVAVVSCWRMVTKRRMLALLRDGTTQDITDHDLDEPLPVDENGDPPIPGAEVLGDLIEVDVETGAPVIRETLVRYAELVVISGDRILEGPYLYRVPRLPVFRVAAWEVKVEGEKVRWGLVRFLKDPQRLHNFSRSSIAERLMQSPRSTWKASDTAVAGREQQWRDANISDDPLLIYNGTSGAPPERVPPAQLDTGFLQQAEISAQDIRDVSNLHEASLGAQSNEVSGKAILARQRVGEVGTSNYVDGLNAAIMECGKVITALIPQVYSSSRIIKVMGDKLDVRLVSINNATDAGSVDLTAGKYEVAITTGPDYVTKRVEASEGMLNLINAFPQIASICGDLIVAAQDWPGADEFARRLQKTLPAGMLDPDKLSVADRQAYDAQQQAQQQQGMAQAEIAELQKQKLLFEVQEQAARAKKAEAESAAIALGAQTASFAAQEKAQTDRARVMVQQEKVNNAE